MAAGEKLGKMNVVAYCKVLSLHINREKRLNNSILQYLDYGSNPGTLDTEAEAWTTRQS